MKYETTKKISLEANVGDILEWKGETNNDVIKFVVIETKEDFLRGMAFHDTREGVSVPHEVEFRSWSLQEYLHRLRKIPKAVWTKW